MLVIIKFADCDFVSAFNYTHTKQKKQRLCSLAYKPFGKGATATALNKYVTGDWIVVSDFQIHCTAHINCHHHLNHAHSFEGC